VPLWAAACRHAVLRLPQVDAKTLQVEGHDNLYALGDVANLPGEKLAYLARMQGETVAKAIAARIAGGKPVEWKPLGLDAMLVCLLPAAFAPLLCCFYLWLQAIKCSSCVSGMACVLPCMQRCHRLMERQGRYALGGWSASFSGALMHYDGRVGGDAWTLARSLGANASCVFRLAVAPHLL
jgi:hypothetical protein